MIDLLTDMVLSEHLTYRDACTMLNEANKKPASKHITFYINGYGKNWSLMGYPKELMKLWMKNAEDFEIDELDD